MNESHIKHRSSAGNSSSGADCRTSPYPATQCSILRAKSSFGVENESLESLRRPSPASPCFCRKEQLTGIANSLNLALNAYSVERVTVESEKDMTEPRIGGGGTEPGAISTPPPTDTSDDATRVGSSLTKSDISRLIEKDYVGLRLLITRRAGDPQVAADSLNEALCFAWERWCAGQIERPELICGYVFQVAINLLHNRSRSVADRADRRAAVEHIDSAYFTADVASREIEAAMAAKVP